MCNEKAQEKDASQAVAVVYLQSFFNSTGIYEIKISLHFIIGCLNNVKVSCISLIRKKRRW